jgi:hypothetical protein
MLCSTPKRGTAPAVAARSVKIYLARSPGAVWSLASSTKARFAPACSVAMQAARGGSERADSRRQTHDTYGRAPGPCTRQGPAALPQPLPILSPRVSPCERARACAALRLYTRPLPLTAASFRSCAARAMKHSSRPGDGSPAKRCASWAARSGAAVADAAAQPLPHRGVERAEPGALRGGQGREDEDRRAGNAVGQPAQRAVQRRRCACRALSAFFAPPREAATSRGAARRNGRAARRRRSARRRRHAARCSAARCSLSGRCPGWRVGRFGRRDDASYRGRDTPGALASAAVRRARADASCDNSRGRLAFMGRSLVRLPLPRARTCVAALTRLAQTTSRCGSGCSRRGARHSRAATAPPRRTSRQSPRARTTKWQRAHPTRRDTRLARVTEQQQQRCGS